MFRYEHKISWVLSCHMHSAYFPQKGGDIGMVLAPTTLMLLIVLFHHPCLYSLSRNKFSQVIESTLSLCLCQHRQVCLLPPVTSVSRCDASLWNCGVFSLSIDNAHGLAWLPFWLWIMQGWCSCSACHLAPLPCRSFWCLAVCWQGHGLAWFGRVDRSAIADRMASGGHWLVHHLAEISIDRITGSGIFC